MQVKDTNSIKQEVVVKNNNSSVGLYINKEVHKTENVSKKNDKTDKINLVNELNTIPKFMKNGISFNYDSETELFIVKLKNKETDEIISQFPSEDFIKKMRRIKIEEENNLSFILDLKI